MKLGDTQLLLGGETGSIRSALVAATHSAQEVMVANPFVTQEPSTTFTYACDRATAQEASVPTIPPLTKFDRWKYQPPDQLLPLTYRAQGMALLAERRGRIDALAGAAQWRARQADVRPLTLTPPHRPSD